MSGEHRSVDSGTAADVPVKLVAHHRRPNRWPARIVLVIGLIATVQFASFTTSAPGVYWSKAQIHFLAPRSADNPNVLQISLRGLAMTAGTVAKMVDNTRPAQVVDPNITLASEGIRSGFSVEQPNKGGQWSNDYGDPYVNVQAVGPSAIDVQQRMQTLIQQIETALLTLQQGQDVDPINYVTTDLSPPTIQLYYQAGSIARAGLASVVFGSVVTLVAASMIRRREARRDSIAPPDETKHTSFGRTAPARRPVTASVFLDKDEDT